MALFGRELQGVSPEELRQLRRKLQIIVQDPVGALNPLKRVRQLAAEGLEVWSDRDPEKVDAMLTAVGLDPEIYAARRRRELSGGQCQRLCIARALLIGPEMLICDEPVSALDVSIQAQIVELLRELQGSMGLSMLFISHDLRIVKSIASRVLVLYMGRVCEVGDADALYSSPTHPYTKLLIEAVEGGAIEADPGEIPSALEPPSGCRFRTRCPAADARCVAEVPQLRQVGDDHFVACHHFPDEAR
ncbi:MAG: transporter protein ATP-binding protein [Acidimicrobiaceae bacterium]|nr:transporter protein ATP-binding protein [Acidimicrobiaceae bacterium]